MHETKTALFHFFEVDWRTDSPSARSCWMLLIATAALLLVGVEADAQVRSKAPDRGVYQPPIVPARSARPVAEPDDSQHRAVGIARYLKGDEPELGELVRTSEPEIEPVDRLIAPVKSTDDHRFADKAKRLRLMDVSVEHGSGRRTRGQSEVVQTASSGNLATSRAKEPARRKADASAGLQRVKHEEVILVQPNAPRLVDSPSVPEIEPAIRLRPRTQILHTDSQHDQIIVDGGELTRFGEVEMHSLDCDGCSSCLGGCDSMGCDSMGCDSMGCDSMGCRTPPWYRRWSNSNLSFRRDR